MIAKVEPRLAGNRFNDGKCDLTGRFWAGTMDIEERRASGALYFLERNKVRRVLGGVTISNGLGWSPNNDTMYYIDTPTRRVCAFDYNAETGKVKDRRTVVDFNPDQQGSPDGMAVDTEGKMWVAHWGGSRVTRWNPATGRPLDAVILPVSQVTSCCFGGRNLDELYITTARTGLDREALLRQPLAGGVFRVKTGLRGLPTNLFDG
jgi:sugar lactone lactonase YvrE